MSYKSYAQPGQFGNYYIDLPIKAEINEDLRAAGDFAKQMQRSQKYREKWAGSYLTALNQKSSIERQNRDDNFEFLQNNFKRIHEGEQREFQARLEEAERQRHEDAKADPSFIEQLVPFLLEVIPQAASVAGAINQSNLEGEVALSKKLLNDNPDITGAQLNSLKNLKDSGLIDSTEWVKISRGFADNHAPNSSYQDVVKVIEQTGEAAIQRDMMAWGNTRGPALDSIKTRTLAGGDLYPGQPKYSGPQGHPTWHQDVSAAIQTSIQDSFGSSGYERIQVSDAVNIEFIQKSVQSVKNGLSNKAWNIWEAEAVEYLAQNDVNHANNAASLGGGAMLEVYNGLVHQELQRKNRDGTDITRRQARVNAAHKFKKIVEKSDWTHSQGVQFRAAFDASRGNIPHGGAIDAQFNEINTILLKRDNNNQIIARNGIKNNQLKQKTDFQQQYWSIKDPIKRNDFLQQALDRDWSHNPEMSKYLSSLASSHVRHQKTFAQKFGYTREQVGIAAMNVAMKNLPTTAANKKLGPNGMKALDSSKVAADDIKAHMLENMPTYIQKYAGKHRPGSEAFLQQIAHDSYMTLKDAGALNIINEGGKDDAAALSQYDKIIGDNSIINNTVKYRELTKREPNKYHPLHLSDRSQFKKYADTVARVKMDGGQLHTPAMVEQRILLHNMPAVKARQHAMEELGTPITLDQSADQLLELAGYPDAITDPFTKKDAESNSQILNRIYDQSKTTTIQGYQAGLVGKNGGNWQPASHVQRTSFTLSGLGGTTPNYDNRSFTYTPEHRAFLDMIAFAEGTYDQLNSGYSTKVGHGQFDHMAGHDKVIPSGQISDASGRYQFLSTTWDNVGGGVMTPEAQDWGAMRLALARLGLPQNTQGVQLFMSRLKTEGMSEDIIDALAPEWASMPNLSGPDNKGRVGTRSSFHGQGGKSYKTLVDFYNKVLNQYSTTHGKVI